VREITKKLTVISVLLLFLVSGFAGASFASIKDNLSDDSVNNETVTLYRYGPDGTVTPIQVNIDLEDGQNVDEAVAEKCSELFNNDMAMRSYLSDGNSSINFSGMAHIRSVGTGFHWKSPVGFRIPFTTILRYRMFSVVPLRYKLFGMKVIPRVYCEYLNDKDAVTEITPLPTPMMHSGNTTRIEGNHTVAIFGFVGYTGWWGMNAKYIDAHKMRTWIDGYAFFTACVKFT
jgi:hypothetical protein